MNCDPNSLAQASRCLECLPEGLLPYARLVTLCNWANAVRGGSFPLSPPGNADWTFSPTITNGTDAGLVSIICPAGVDGWDIEYHDVTTNTIVNSSDIACDFHDSQLFAFGDVITAKIRWSLSGTPVSSWSSEKTVTLISSAAAAQVTDWVTRISNAGGAAPSNDHQLAHAIFWDTLNSHGLISKLKIVQTFTPDNLIAAITPFIKGSAVPSWTNTNFVLADISVNGLRGNGVNKSLDLNVGGTPSSIWASATDVGASFYATSKETSGSSRIAFGVFDAVLASASLGYSNQFTTNFSINFWNSGGTTSPATANPGLGFFSASRSSTTNCTSYWGNTTNPVAQQGLNATLDTLAAGSNGSMVVFACRSNTGTIFDWSDIRMSGIFFHTALGQADCQNLKNDFETLRTALGGGFV
jgi:hypothetical protein